MITARAFAGKSYCVLGLARSGMATVEALLASGARVTAWDEREAARAALVGRDVVLADPLEAPLEGFDALVVSPGVPLNTHKVAQRARAAGVPIIGDIELFARARGELPEHKVVGITGTNGKSTTTALVHHILAKAGVPSLMGGNIGLPILSQSPLPSGGVYVLELSSYQIDLTQSLDCDVAVLLNITPDHLDRYDGSFEHYALSKMRLIGMQSNDKDVVITENGFVAGWPITELVDNAAQQGGPRQHWPNVSGGNDWGASFVAGALFWDGRRVAAQSEWGALQGPHNAQNVAAAVTTCRLLGLPIEIVASGLATYPGLPHRMERVGEVAGVLFVNDSKATNPDSTAPALAAFPPQPAKRLHWICGGVAKDDNLDACLPHLGNVARAYTIGEAGPLFARLLGELVPVDECGTLDAALDRAFRASRAGDVILLSPACASFDQFRDFEARGAAFCEGVARLSRAAQSATATGSIA